MDDVVGSGVVEAAAVCDVYYRDLRDGLFAFVACLCDFNERFESQAVVEFAESLDCLGLEPLGVGVFAELCSLVAGGVANQAQEHFARGGVRLCIGGFDIVEHFGFKAGLGGAHQSLDSFRLGLFVVFGCDNLCDGREDFGICDARCGLHRRGAEFGGLAFVAREDFLDHGVEVHLDQACGNQSGFGIVGLVDFFEENLCYIGRFNRDDVGRRVFDISAAEVFRALEYIVDVLCRAALRRRKSESYRHFGGFGLELEGFGEVAVAGGDCVNKTSLAACVECAEVEVFGNVDIGVVGEELHQSCLSLVAFGQFLGQFVLAFLCVGDVLLVLEVVNRVFDARADSVEFDFLRELFKLLAACFARETRRPEHFRHKGAVEFRADFLGNLVVDEFFDLFAIVFVEAVCEDAEDDFVDFLVLFAVVGAGECRELFERRGFLHSADCALVVLREGSRVGFEVADCELRQAHQHFLILGIGIVVPIVPD